MKSSSDEHLFLGIKLLKVGVLPKYAIWDLIFRANVLSQSESYTFHISYFGTIDYINYSIFWFVFQHFTCSTYYRQTAERDEEPKGRHGGPSDCRTWRRTESVLKDQHGKEPNICPSDMLKDWKCPSGMMKDCKCPSDMMKDCKCPSDMMKDWKCPSDLIKDQNYFLHEPKQNRQTNQMKIRQTI